MWMGLVYFSTLYHTSIGEVKRFPLSVVCSIPRVTRCELLGHQVFYLHVRTHDSSFHTTRSSGVKDKLLLMRWQIKRVKVGAVDLTFMTSTGQRGCEGGTVYSC